MASIVLIYSTVDGHTREICERLRDIVEREGHELTLTELDGQSRIDLEPFDRVVIGASIRYGKHQQEVFDFIARNQAQLETMSNALFSVNVVARKPEKNTPETNPYLQKFLKKIAWQPQNLAVFAGKIDYTRYGFMDRTMIRFIMWMTKGPTDPTQTIEFTDWNKVDEFGQRILDM